MERRYGARQVRMLFLAALLACGGAAEVAAPSKPPPSEVLAMQVAVRPGGADDTFCQAFELGLARSGIPIANVGAPADLVVSCHPFVTEDDSFIRMEVNGQRKMKFTVRVEVRDARDGALVDQFVADYTGYRGGPPDEDVVAKTVVGYAYSPRMAAYARALAQNRSPTVVAQPTAAATVAAPREDTRDDSDWFAIDTVKCKIPARVDACDAVRRYLQRHPEGAHAQEANAVLAAAQPALEKLQKDDVAWNKANHSECASRRTSDACVGVEAYELEFPTGQHADYAHRLLKAAGVDK